MTMNASSQTHHVSYTQCCDSVVMVTSSVLITRTAAAAAAERTDCVNSTCRVVSCGHAGPLTTEI